MRIMWQRFSLYDVRVIGHYLGALILFFALALVVPFVVALFCHEWEPASHYLLTIGIALIVGNALRFLRIAPGRLNRQQALAVTGLAWIAIAAVSAIPLYLSGHYANAFDAFFEGVSGVTTTGASVVQDLDHMSTADNMWRFVMHYIGGLGLIVVAMSFGLFGKRAGASLYSSEGRSEHVVPNVVQTTRIIAKIATCAIIIVTVLLTSMCLLLGMEPSRAAFHSLWIAVSGFLTGGFVPMSENIMYYHSLGLEMVLLVVMVLGSFNFGLYTEKIRGRTLVFFRDLEIRTMVVWLAAVTFVFAASLTAAASFSDLGAMLRRGLFMLIAASSTTGFQNITANQLTTVFSSGAFLVIAAAMAVGASAGGTAGGIKLQRVGLIGKTIVATIKEALAPDSARVVVDYNHIGRRLVSPEVAKDAMTVFALYVITYALGALAGIAHGYDALQAIFESIAMTSNAGLTSGIVAPDMPPTLEAVYIFQMWAGRLEFITLLALIVEVVVSIDPRRFRRFRSRRRSDIGGAR